MRSVTAIKLENAMKKAGINASKLAKLTGLNKSTISNYLNGKRQPENYEIIANALGCEVQDLKGSKLLGNGTLNGVNIYLENDDTPIMDDDMHAKIEEEMILAKIAESLDERIHSKCDPFENITQLMEHFDDLVKLDINAYSMLTTYTKLNAEGKGKIKDYVNDLYLIEKYKI